MSWKNTVGTLAAGIMLAPVGALVTAHATSTVWDWYLVRNYGEGPQFATWYGISVIIGLLMMGSLSSVQEREKTDEEQARPIAFLVGRCVALWATFYIIVGAAWLVGQITGWL